MVINLWKTVLWGMVMRYDHKKFMTIINLWTTFWKLLLESIKTYPPVNWQFDPGSHRGWKISETTKNWWFSGSMFICHRVVVVVPSFSFPFILGLFHMPCPLNWKSAKIQAIQHMVRQNHRLQLPPCTACQGYPRLCSPIMGV